MKFCGGTLDTRNCKSSKLDSPRLSNGSIERVLGRCRTSRSSRGNPSFDLRNEAKDAADHGRQALDGSIRFEWVAGMVSDLLPRHRADAGPESAVVHPARAFRAAP